MLGDEIILESAASELAKKLPSLAKHDYNTIDTLMRKIASKHHITGKALHDLFIKKFDRTPDEWIKNKLDEALSPVKKNKYGSKTNQVEAFFRHLATMTPAQWTSLETAMSQIGHDQLARQHRIADMAAKQNATLRQRDLAHSDAWEAAQGNTATKLAASMATQEIQGANMFANGMYGEFFFLPMFGFDIPEEIPHANIKKTPKGTRTKTDWEPLDEDGEDQNWRDDPMQWHGSQNDEYEDWYEEQKYKPLRVKVHNISGMGFQPASGVYTVRNFKKISTTNAEVSVFLQGALVTGIVNLSHPDTHIGRNGRIPNMEFYTDSRPITARQAFNIFQTRLHDNIKKKPKARPKIIWEPLDEDGENGPDYIGGNPPPHYDYLEFLSQKPLVMIGTDNEGEEVREIIKEFTRTGPSTGRIGFILNGQMVHMDVPINGDLFLLGNFGLGDLKMNSRGRDLTTREAYNLFQLKKKVKPVKKKIDWEPLDEDKGSDLDLQSEVDKFVDWSVKRLHIKNKPAVELSMDTEEAQNNHHTGGHIDGDDSIWVYAKNRNLVDILRTVFHELVHVRQGELNMIRPGSSYPGSPIEAMADMLAGKWIKIYGEKNHHIFE